MGTPIYLGHRLRRLERLASFVPAVRQALHPVYRILKALERANQEQRRTLAAMMEEELAGSVPLIKLAVAENGVKRRSLIDQLELSLASVINSDSGYLTCRAGVGGKEAEFFSQELLSAYANALGRRATAEGVPIVGEEQEWLKFEVGTVRVQRVPVTESSGRLHTSTVCLAIVPNISLGIEVDRKDLRVEHMRSSGPGGQFVNTTSSAVRVTHVPTGLFSRVGTQREQEKNYDTAMGNILEQMREELNDNIHEVRYGSKAALTGERSEKYRTFNFPEDRITDHRIGRAFHRLQETMRSGKKFAELITEVGDYIRSRELEGA